MANLSFTHFLIVFLALTAASMVPEANAQKRCQEELYKTGCTLEDCKKKCYDRHRDLGGTCIQNAAMTAYACYCFWNSASIVPEANAQKRCQEELYKTGCTLEDCKKKCYDRHHDLGGACIQNAAITGYICYCFWNCN
eukprot:XP_025015224.1 putative defensin-like protein 165 [Ricinus communis]